MLRKHWLVKNEPKECSFDELKTRSKSTGYWTGVRNYQARNFIRDGMQKGDLAFYYHSNCDEPGIAGIVEIVKPGYADPNQFDKKHRYYDEKSNEVEPRWYSFDVVAMLFVQRAIERTRVCRPHRRLAKAPGRPERKSWRSTRKER